MILLYDPSCISYGSPTRPEQPARIIDSAALLRTNHPDWAWRLPTMAGEDLLLTAHTPALLQRIQQHP